MADFLIHYDTLPGAKLRLSCTYVALKHHFVPFLPNPHFWMRWDGPPQVGPNTTIRKWLLGRLPSQNWSPQLLRQRRCDWAVAFEKKKSALWTWQAAGKAKSNLISATRLGTHWLAAGRKPSATTLLHFHVQFRYSFACRRLTVTNQQLVQLQADLKDKAKDFNCSSLWASCFEWSTAEKSVFSWCGSQLLGRTSKCGKSREEKKRMLSKRKGCPFVGACLLWCSAPLRAYCNSKIYIYVNGAPAHLPRRL